MNRLLFFIFSAILLGLPFMACAFTLPAKDIKTVIKIRFENNIVNSFFMAGTPLRLIETVLSLYIEESAL